MSTATKPPPLVAGDHLSIAEFERRYLPLTEVKYAELIEGIVYMPSRVPVTTHAEPHSQLIGLIGRYSGYTKGVSAGVASTVRLDQDNEVQPDLSVVIDPKSGGNCRYTPEGYLERAPELIAEICYTDTNKELHVKKNVYRRNGVQEYIVWRTVDKAFDWFTLIEGQFIPLNCNSEGIVKSSVLPGLWLDPNAILRGDFDTACKAVEAGLKSPEHAEFVQRLAAK